MKRIINYTISKIKGREFTIDSNIPTSYLFMLIYRRLRMVSRGLFTFCKKKGIVFIGKNVEIKCISLLQLGKNVTIDDNVYVDALSKEGIKLGNNVSIGKRCIIECTGSINFLGKGLSIGANSGLGSFSFLGCAGGIYIGENTIMGNFVSIHSENHNYDKKDIPILLQGVNHKGIKIGNNCWIGAKVTILDGAIVEDGCVIAAGALLKSGLYEKDSIYGGIPAKFIKKRVE